MATLNTLLIIKLICQPLESAEHSGAQDILKPPIIKAPRARSCGLV